MSFNVSSFHIRLWWEGLSQVHIGCGGIGRRSNNPFLVNTKDAAVSYTLDPASKLVALFDFQHLQDPLLRSS